MLLDQRLRELPTRKVRLALPSCATARKHAAVTTLRLPLAIWAPTRSAADERATESSVEMEEKWDAETGV